MSRNLVLCIDRVERQSETREFRRVALRLAERLNARLVYYVNGIDMLYAVRGFDRLDNVVIIGHGTTAWVGEPGIRGLHKWRSHNEAISVPQLGPELRKRHCASIALACCMADASPAWYRTKVWGRVVAPWGPASHAPGGRYSLAASLSRFSGAVVLGHTTSGHATYNPAIRVFHPDEAVGQSLKPPTMSRREWNGKVKGPNAESLLICASDPRQYQ